MSQLRISESSVGPFKAKEIRLLCPHCQQSVYVTLPWNFTAEIRQRLVQAAVEEHRRLCTFIDESTETIYSISYPRG